MIFSQTFATIGIISTSFLFIRFLRFIHLYTRPSSLKRYLHSNDAWAFVTGASDGIGRGFAYELAQNGFNVVLHGRNATKLERVKAQLQDQFPMLGFRILIADASSSSYWQINDLVTSIHDLHLTVLINNVGGAITVAPLDDTTSEHVDAIINLNARFPTQLTKALLPKLTQTNSPSLIMNIGSMGDFCVPYATIYGGSKGFNMTWSSSLAMELKSEGKKVEVLAVSVGRVTDVSHNKKDASFFTPSAGTMAKAALQRVGCGKPVVVGYVGHALQKFLVGLLPFSITSRAITSLMKGVWKESQRNQ